MRLAAQTMERRIRERTLRGEFGPNSTGNYKQYERDYANRKRKGGLSPVNLKDTGAMIDGMKGVASFPTGSGFSGTGGRKGSPFAAIGIRFSSEKRRRIAEYHDQEGIRAKSGRKRRQFLYVDENDAAAIMAEYERELGIKIENT